MSSLYDLLGVKPDALQSEIKDAYRRACTMYHPDKNSEPGAAELFVSIKRAYETLSDPVKRKQYDNTGDTSDDALAVDSMVIQNLTVNVRNFIEASIREDGRVPDFTQLVDHFRDTLSMAITSRCHVEARIKRLKKMKRKINIRKMPDLYDNVYEDMMTELEGKLKIKQIDIKVYKKIIKILKDVTIATEDDFHEAFTSMLEQL